jgi:uncharacterized membrane protein YphA (DoxX/SURF4 family)
MNENKQYNRLLWSRPLFFWGRLLLGAIFILASVDKILHPAAFAKIIYNYQLLPDGAVNLTAIMLPWVELLLGLLLMLGLWIPGAVVLSNLLLLIFFGAILFNSARGLDVNCGCFSTTGEAASGAPMVWYLLRDGLFLLLALYIFFYVFLIKRPTNRRAV